MIYLDYVDCEMVSGADMAVDELGSLTSRNLV